MLLGKLRRRRQAAATRTLERPYATPHACSAVVDGLPQLDSPLVTELIALQAHTRHLGWLSAREQCPEEYRHLARLVLQHVLEGWHAQTGGRGRLEDLLVFPDPAGPVPGHCQHERDHMTTYGS
ncbi:hypothetical protein M878_45895 (plasmid) [Streptomyces roseochromogenus subsp. oscitans DS 12.976]|uniref:Uncharacterized protein n=2 Tax=Streptomyces roseochromogenus TaxID=285450 RepID=V6JMC7_STRRC|nr:hypothetical protein M878_45895 [Streptomyces roseochromogenus subsp. oscitans DS 12.976]